MKTSLITALIVFTSLSVLAQTPLSLQFEQIAGKTQAKIGVFARVLETGDTASFRGREHFPMQSVYKFPIAMVVLDLVDKRKLQLDQPIRVLPADLLQKGHSPIREQHPNGNFTITISELLRYSVAESDGTACDVLLRVIGGCAKAQAYLHSIGIYDINIATMEKEQLSFDDLVQYRNWATPAELTRLFQLYYQGKLLSKNSQSLLLGWLTNTSIGAKRLKGQLPAGTVVVHKTGTSSTYYGLTRATNDAGIITLPNGKHLAITVFVSDSYASQDDREAIIAAMASAAFNYWKDK